MYHLVESIKIYNGKVYNIQHHDKRVAKTCDDLYGVNMVGSLRPYIKVPDDMRQGLVKCRLLYDANGVEDIQYAKYQPQEKHNVAIVEADNIAYPYKYVPRPTLDEVRYQHKDLDEIIMVKGGLVTDAYYYNVVIDWHGKLLTPESPLLEGTMRARLLRLQKVIATKVDVQMLKEAKAVYLINALNPLGSVKVTKLIDRM